MTKKGMAVCLFFLFLLSSVFGADDENSLLKRSQLLVQKGEKAEERGNIDDAVASYEEAYNLYPKNIMPLLSWGRALSRIGMHKRAAELLEKIPVDKLPSTGQSEVHLLLSRIALAGGNLERSAALVSKSLSVSSENMVARLRLAAMNRIFGFNERAEELLASDTDALLLPGSELALAVLLSFNEGRLLRAWQICGYIAHSEKSGDKNAPGSFFSVLAGFQPFLYLLALPLSLNSFISCIYFVILFCCLALVAARTTTQTTFWHSLMFVAGGVVTLMVTQLVIRHDLFIAAMMSDFSPHDSVWILPHLLVAGHLLALALFAIFPAFTALPEGQRPLRYELYSIWFFCWFFMMFVLVFQSRIDFLPRMLYMALALVLTAVTSFFMPLGRFVYFKLATLAGFDNFTSGYKPDMRKNSNISFTDAKILETKAWKMLEKDEFGEILVLGRKILYSFDGRSFPTLWKAVILASIYREDFVEAQKYINEFLALFKSTFINASGQLLDALLKSKRGDFAGALKIIKFMSDNHVRAFLPDETALSLLVLGKCGLAYNENVQAHIDLAKAVNCARIPFIKAEALLEVAELDYTMKSKEALNKWKDRAPEIAGGETAQSYVKILLSISALFDNKKEEAIALAQAACIGKEKNSRAHCWLGRLFCIEGRYSEAEALLAQMTPDSNDAQKLMERVTSAGA